MSLHPPVHRTPGLGCILLTVLSLTLLAPSSVQAHPPVGDYTQFEFTLRGHMIVENAPIDDANGRYPKDGGSAGSGNVTVHVQHNAGGTFGDGADVRLTDFYFDMVVNIFEVITDIEMIVEEGGDAHGTFKASNFEVQWDTPVTHFHSFGVVDCKQGDLCAAGFLDPGINPQDDTIDAEFIFTDFNVQSNPLGIRITYALPPDPSGTKKTMFFYGELTNPPLGDVVSISDPDVALDASPEAVEDGSSTTLTWQIANATDCTPLGDWPPATGVKNGFGNETVDASGGSAFALQCAGTPDKHASLVVAGIDTCPDVDLSVFGGLVNDECDQPTVLYDSTACSVRVNQSTTGATTTEFEPVSSCEDQNDPSSTVWYEYSSDVTRFVTVTTAGSDYPTSLSVWWQSEQDEGGLEGCDGLVNEFSPGIDSEGGIGDEEPLCASDPDDATTSSNEITFKAVSGKGYLIKVGDASGAGGGDLQVKIFPEPIVTLDANDTQSDQTGIEYEIDGERDSCEANGDWSGDIPGSGSDVVALNAAGSLFTLSCDDAELGDTHGSFAIAETATCQPIDFDARLGLDSLVNDECLDATTLYGDIRDGGTPADGKNPDPCSVSVAQSTDDATVTGRELADTQISACVEGLAPTNTVWFRYTALFSSAVTLSTVGSDYDTLISAWREEQGCGEFTQEVACGPDPDSEQAVNSDVEFAVKGGETYLFSVGDISASGLGGNLKFQVIPRIKSVFGTSVSDGEVEFTWASSGGFESCVGVGDPDWIGDKPASGSTTFDESEAGFYGYDCIVAGESRTQKSALIVSEDDCAPVTMDGLVENPNDGCFGGTHLIIPGECPVRIHQDASVAIRELRETLDDPKSQDNGSQISSCAPPIGPYPTHSVWYRWKAYENNPVMIATIGSDYPTTISVWSARGGCNELPDNIPGGCNQELALPSGDGSEARSLNRVTFQATAGDEYFIQIADSNAAGDGGTGGNLNFTMRVPEPGSGLLQGAAALTLLALARRKRSQG